MTDNALVKVIDRAPLKFTSEQVQMIKDQYGRGASDAEFGLYLEIAKHNRLDPFKNQIYLVGRWDSKLGRKIYKPQTSIEGLRAKADETGVYAGSQIFWCGKDGQWLDVWLSDEYPAAAKAEVWKMGSSKPFVHVVRWKEYYPGDKMGFMWKSIPSTMLGKCAEGGALRKGFPDACAGMYVKEEMEQAGYRDEPQTAQVINETTGEVAQQYQTPPTNEQLKTNYDPQTAQVHSQPAGASTGGKSMYGTDSNPSVYSEQEQARQRMLFGSVQFPFKRESKGKMYDEIPFMPAKAMEKGQGWALEPATQQQRVKLMATLAEKGYGDETQRRQLYQMFYRCCGIQPGEYMDVPNEDGKLMTYLSSTTFTKGIMGPFITMALALMGKADTDPVPWAKKTTAATEEPPPPADPLAEDPALLEDGEFL